MLETFLLADPGMQLVVLTALPSGAVCATNPQEARQKFVPISETDNTIYVRREIESDKVPLFTDVPGVQLRRYLTRTSGETCQDKIRILRDYIPGPPLPAISAQDPLPKPPPKAHARNSSSRYQSQGVETALRELKPNCQSPTYPLARACSELYRTTEPSIPRNPTSNSKSIGA